MKLKPSDLEISTYNTGSAWAAKFNGVRILHIPTRIVATCATSESVHKNRHEAELALADKVEAHIRQKSQIKFGGRAMPAIEKESITIYRLTLSAEEAAILRAMVQNPLMEDEPIEARELREKLFHGLAE